MSYLFPISVIFAGYNLIGSILVYLLFLFMMVQGVIRGVFFSRFLLVFFIFGFFLFAGAVRLEEFDFVYFIRYTVVVFYLFCLIFLAPLKINFSCRPVIYVAAFQSLFIFAVSLYLFFNNFDTWQSVRFFVKNSGFGDIWTIDGYYYRVQLRGNPLIVVGWLAQLFLVRVFSVKDKIIFSILSVGLIVAGNFTFLLAALLALVAYSLFYKKWSLFLFIVFGLFFALASGILDELLFVLVRKFGGGQSSMGARLEQIVVVFRAIYFEGYYFHGAGAGAPYPLGRYGDGGWRTIAQYIEVQLLLYFYKYGFFSGLLLTFSVLFSVFLFELRVGFFIFFYLIASVTNPYFLDANHFLVLLIAHGFKRSKFRIGNDVL